MDLTQIGSLITAMFAGIGGLLVALNGRDRRRRQFDEEDEKELDSHREWRGDVKRWHADERARLADQGVTLEPLPDYPPVKSKTRRRQT